MTLPTDKTERKERPIARGVLDYFPDAIAEVARVSYVGNQQHNPGEDLHWSRGKSTDHADCIARHLIDRGKTDDDGMRHSAKAAWRALALLQIELEEAASEDGDEEQVFQAEMLDEGEYDVGLDLGAGDDGTATFVASVDSLQPGTVALEFGSGATHKTVRTYVRDRIHSRGVTAAEKCLITDCLVIQGCSAGVAEHIVGGVSYPAEKTPRRSAYISGPMRGYPQFNFPAFDAARERLTAAGWAVVSPADIDRAADDTPTADTGPQDPELTQRFVYRDFWAIFGLSKGPDAAIAVLPGWEKSTGSVAEVMLGRWLGLAVINAVTGDPLPYEDVDVIAMYEAFRNYLDRA